MTLSATDMEEYVEAFRALRTSLLLSSAGHPPVTILLTSATPSEGKTTISFEAARTKLVFGAGNASDGSLAPGTSTLMVSSRGRKPCLA